MKHKGRVMSKTIIGIYHTIIGGFFTFGIGFIYHIDNKVKMENEILITVIALLCMFCTICILIFLMIHFIVKYSVSNAQLKNAENVYTNLNNEYEAYQEWANNEMNTLREQLGQLSNFVGALQLGNQELSEKLNKANQTIQTLKIPKFTSAFGLHNSLLDQK